jgi:formamidopyrimidine-DNA glycosylase
MPELPDIALYLHALEPRVLGARIEGVRIASPFVLRTTTPPITDIAGRVVRGAPVQRIRYADTK